MTVMSSENIIRLTKFGTEWKNGLPIGNGRIGAMIFGNSDSTLALNHELLYTGKNADRDVEAVPLEKLAQVRKMLLEGNYAEGGLLANDLYGGSGGISKEPNRNDPYQPAGNLIITNDVQETAAYQRWLDLGKALLHSECVSGDNKISRDFFASSDSGNGCICVKLDSSLPVNWSVSFKRPQDPLCTLETLPYDKGFTVYGSFRDDSHFAVTVHIELCDGNISFADGILSISEAKKAEIFVNLGAGVKSYDVKAEAGKFPCEAFDTLLEKHISKYSKRFHASDISVDVEVPELPTEQRLDMLRKGKSDDSIPLLWYNYAKYLLISSCGALPPTLQGIWNDDITPPWECDFHFDINLQMCYWFAEAAALSDTTESLFNFCEKLVPHAREAAEKLYGCKGILFPLQTDAHGRATPESYGWSVWLGAAPWAALHFWERWEYSRDKKFLAEHAYPFIKAVAEFFSDYLYEVNGVMELVPSQSPENRFGNDKLPVTICVSSSMDVELCSATLAHASEAAVILGTDEKEARHWDELRAKLPKLKVGSQGQLLEWNEEFAEDEPGHRHFSHLIGAYPMELITEERTPELFSAAKRSLELRLSHGGGHTGWSRSWTACMLSRFGDAEAAWEHLIVLIKDFATDSLLDLHPPRIFQIDGNFGGAAAVSEMMLRSFNDCFTILPALPKAWHKAGKVSGMKVKNGFTVSFEWKNAALTSLEISSELNEQCVFECAGISGFSVKDSSGNGFNVNSNGGKFSFPAVSGSSYILTPINI